jgi:hypothetical protein
VEEKRFKKKIYDGVVCALDSLAQGYVVGCEYYVYATDTEYREEGTTRNISSAIARVRSLIYSAHIRSKRKA